MDMDRHRDHYTIMSMAIARDDATTSGRRMACMQAGRHLMSHQTHDLMFARHP